MEVFGGFMMMLSIIGFFLTVIWFAVPFVIFNIKGKVDRTLVVMEDLERRLAALERALQAREQAPAAQPENPPPSGSPL
ncbi:MAG TPA: hypothetical protein VJ550_10025 [Geomonas sp.]|nr:hypothetical protein [Geomonas sp.]